MTTERRSPLWTRELLAQAQAATPGPWYVRRTDDSSFMAAFYVTHHKGDDSLDVPAWGHPTSVVAITLLQDPSRAVSPQHRENAAFIVAAREGVPRLCDALERALNQRASLARALRRLISCSDVSTQSAEFDEARDDASRVLEDLGAD